MNWLYAVMTIQLIGSIFTVTFEREYDAFLPLVTCLATVTDRHMAGVGDLRARETNTDRVNMALVSEFLSPKIELKSRQNETPC